MFTYFMMFFGGLVLLILLIVPLRIGTVVFTRFLKRRRKKLKERKRDLSERQESLKESRDGFVSNGEHETFLAQQYKLNREGTKLMMSSTVYNIMVALNTATKWVLRVLTYLLGPVMGIGLALTLVMTIGMSVVFSSVLPDVILPIAVSSTSSTRTSYLSRDAGLMGIDWTQDFTEVFESYEELYGKRGRTWAELLVLSMEISQINVATGLDSTPIIPGIINGIKAIESGQTLNPTVGLTEGYNYAGTYRGDTGVDTGLLQLDTKWERYNSAYTFDAKTREAEGGRAIFLPDAVYGVLLRLAGNVELERERAMVIEAFKMCGYDGSEDKYDYVQKVLTISTRFNAIFLANDPGFNVAKWFPHGLTVAQTEEAALGNAVMLVLLFENYGYGPTDEILALVTSLYDTAAAQGKNAGIEYALYKNYAARAYSGLADGGNKNYPADLAWSRAENFGVLDVRGNPIKGSLFEYLLTLAPAEVKSFMLNNSGYKSFAKASTHYWRTRYDIPSYLMGMYDVALFKSMLGG